MPPVLSNSKASNTKASKTPYDRPDQSDVLSSYEPRHLAEEHAARKDDIFFRPNPIEVAILKESDPAKRKNLQLSLACDLCDVHAVEFYLTHKKADPNAFLNELNALQRAINSRKNIRKEDDLMRVVTMLLDAGAVRVKTDEYRCQFWYAATGNLLKVVKTMLSYKAFCNALYTNALHEEDLDRWGDLYGEEDDGSYSLACFVAGNGQLEMLKLLSEFDATILDEEVARAGRHHPEIVIFLAERNIVSEWMSDDEEEDEEEDEGEEEEDDE